MIIDKLITELGWEVDSRALDEFRTQNKSIIDFGKKLAGMAALASGALATLGGVITKETVRNLKLAESVGMSSDSYLAWEGVLGHVGFEGEKVIDLMEEMTNKFGELKGLGDMTSARESMQLLGLDFKEIKQLAPEEQFIKILDAAKGLEDIQVAQSAVDMLMGGEANRVLGILRQYDGSVQDILRTHRDLNLLTDEGIAGAIQWSYAWDNLTTSAKSLIGEVAGQAGAVIAPYVNQVLEWAAANRELIRSNVTSFIEGLTTALRWLVRAGTGINDVVQDLGGFTRLIKLSTLAIVAWKGVGWLAALQKIVPVIAVAVKQTGLLKTAAALLGKVPIVALFVGAALAVQDLIVGLRGGKSLFFEMAKTYVPKAEKSFLRFIGVIRDLTDEEKEAIRESENLADSVDVQKYFETMETAKFREKVSDTFRAIGEGYDDVVEYHRQAARDLASGASSAFSTLKSGFNSVVDYHKQAAQSLWGYVGPVFSAIGTAVERHGELATGIYEKIAGAMRYTGDVGVEVYKWLTDGASELFGLITQSKAWESFVTGFESIRETASNVFTAIAEFHKTAWKQLTETSLFKVLTLDIGDFWTAAVKAIKDVTAKLKGVPIVGKFLDWWSSGSSAPSGGKSSATDENPKPLTNLLYDWFGKKPSKESTSGSPSSTRPAAPVLISPSPAADHNFTPSPDALKMESPYWAPQSVAPVTNNSTSSAVTNNTKQTVQVNAPVTVNASPGQSSADIGGEVSRQLGAAVRTAIRETNTGVKR